jgi:uncharacterized protein YwqG
MVRWSVDLMSNDLPQIAEARDHDVLRTRIDSFGLDQYAEIISEMSRPSVRFRLEPCESESLPERSTFFGGSPDVPIDFQWPSFRSRPLTFIAQIDLSEMFAYVKLPLPSAGLLSFFYEAADQPWGEIGEAGSCAVFWIPPDVVTRREVSPRRESPENGQRLDVAYIRLCRAIPRAAMTLPSDESPLAAPILRVAGDISSPIVAAYTSLRESLGCYADTQLGGHPAELQGPVELDADYGAFGSRDDGRSSNWDSLLTVGCEDNALGIMWALSGALYILNPPGCSARSDFSNAWAVIQGT